MTRNHKEPTAANPSNRLLSIDALRGMDMAWIIGLSTIVGELNGWLKLPFTDWMYRQTLHAEWIGFTFFDIIMPLFMRSTVDR